MPNGLFGTDTTVPTIRQPAIQPTATPGSTYVRPVQRETGGNLRALADAMGNLNQSLRQYGSTVQHENADPDSEVNRAFADQIAGLSLEEAMQRYPDAKNRIQKDGVLSLVGAKAAFEFRQHVTDAYNSGEFDQSRGDFNSWVEAKRRDYAKGLPEQAMQAAFFRGTDAWIQRAGEADLQRKIDTATVERDTAVIDEFRLIAEDADAAGWTPDEVAEAVIRQSAENRTFRALDGRAQNATLMALVEEYALKGQPDTVKAILQNRRGGVGPLIEVSGITDKAMALIARAEDIQENADLANSFNTQAKLDEDATFGRITKDGIRAVQAAPGNSWLTDQKAAQYLDVSNRNKQAMLEAQAREEQRRRMQFNAAANRTQVHANAWAELNTLGGAHRLQDVEYLGENGEMKVLTAKDQEREAVRRAVTGFEEYEKQLVERGTDPKQAREETLQRRIAWFDGNGIVDEQLRNKFNSAPFMSSISRTLQKGEVSGYLGGVAEDYRQIADLNPAYAEKLVSDAKATEFLENYVAGRNDLMGEEDALIHATMQTTRTPSQRAMASLSPSDEEDAIGNVFNELDLDSDPSLQNRADVQDEINSYIARGLRAETAVARTVKKLSERSFELNGKIVMDEDGLPKDAPILFEAALKDAYDALGKAEGLPGPEDLYVERFASGQWIIMSKTKAGPLSMGSRIDLKTLGAKRSAMDRHRKDLQQAALTEDKAKRKAALDALKADMADELGTVERWEKRAQGGKMIPKWVAGRLRKNYEQRLKEFNSPPAPIDIKARTAKPRTVKEVINATIEDTADVVGKTAREADPWLR